MKKLVWLWSLFFACFLPAHTFAQETTEIEGEWTNRPVNQYEVEKNENIKMLGIL
jgi:hypothetical protein